MIPSPVHRPAWIALLALGLCGTAQAFVVNIDRGPRAIYLRVGDGTMSGGSYYYGGTPTNDPTRNTVSVAVPAAAVGNGADQAMAGNGRLTSDYEGYGFCNPGQIYVGGFYRGNNNGGTASLTATAPATLNNGAGDSIPFAQIAWDSSGNGDTGAQPIPGGSFASPVQTLAAFPVNRWQESCHSFRYRNTNVVPAGTYNGTVLYTLSSP